VSDDFAAEAAEGEAPVSWREAAVARSLDSARSRAESRVQRFLDAALELMADGDGKEFTVQEVVERSGQSLRSFYQYFGGKHELLLALFEESVRTTADKLGAEIAKEKDPLERLHQLVIGYYRICRPSAKSKAAKKTAVGPQPVLVEFAQQLLTAHPADAARAYTPVVTLFDDVIGEAIDAGVVRADVDRSSISGVLVEAISFNIFSSTISGTLGRQDRAEAAEELWRLLFHGLQSR
jgi:AcrR family transcriptional regulator